MTDPIAPGVSRALPGKQMFAALWSYRGFVWNSVLREFNARYRESLFGALWSIAGPLTMIVIYTVVFSRIMGPMLPGHESTPFAFSIYLCSGVITWSLFAEMLGQLSNVFLDNGNLIKKSSFPRICLPVIVVSTALINFAISLALFLAFLLFLGHWPGWALLALLPLLMLQVLFALGLGVFLGTLNVFFRDVGQFTAVVLQFWFWLTPIVYTSRAVPESIQEWLALNPMLPLINGYQSVFLEGTVPAFSSLLPLICVTLFFLFVGARFFLRQVGEMVDEL